MATNKAIITPLSEHVRIRKLIYFRKARKRPDFMHYLIADLPAILKNPKLLGGKPDEVQIVIPMESVEDQADYGSEYGKAVWQIIRSASDSEHIRVVTMQDSEFSTARNVALRTGLTGGNLAMLVIAIRYKVENRAVVVATENNLLKKACKEHNIELFDTRLVKYFKSDSRISPSNIYLETEINDGVKDVTDLNLKESKKQLLTIITSALLSIGIVFFFQNITNIIESITVWGTIFMFFATSVFLFWWRGKEQLSYGVIEFFVGFIYAIMVLYNGRFNLADTIKSTEVDFKLIGCLYIMVRGLDNFVKGVNTGPLPNQFKKWFEWLVINFNKLVSRNKRKTLS